MKDQLQTIRAGIAAAIDSETFIDKPVRRALLDALTALKQIEQAVGKQEFSLAFYKRRCDALQQWQNKMRDPERTIVCDILANGHTLEPAGDRYTTPPAQQPQADPDWKHPKIQALIGADARNRITINLIWRILKEPEGDWTSASDMEYWGAIHDAVQTEVMKAQQQPQSRPDFTDEWTAYLKDGETPFERFLRERRDLSALTQLYQRALEENERLKAQQPQAEVGNSGFDHKTAADFLSGKTVSDEAVRKFVQASRWAHDDRASLQSMLLSVRNELATREAEIALLKKELMDAEAAPQRAEVVPSDVVRLMQDASDWICDHVPAGTHAATSWAKKLQDAAMQQGGA